MIETLTTQIAWLVVIIGLPIMIFNGLAMCNDSVMKLWVKIFGDSE